MKSVTAHYCYIHTVTLYVKGLQNCIVCLSVFHHESRRRAHV